MADTQTAPHPSAQPIPALGGSVTEAQEALLSLLDPEEETPEKEEAQPTEVEESQPEEEDESLEDGAEEEEESEEVEEDEEESEETDEGDEGALYAVTVNGKEQEVSLDELLNGYSRQSDYTRKTQELSSEKKEMEELHKAYTSEIQQIQAERQQYMENLQQIIEGSSGEMSQFTSLDWQDLKDSDPIGYVTKREELRESQEKVQNLKNQRDVARQKQAADAEGMRKSLMKEEHGKLVSALPEWGDTKKQAKLASDIKSYG